MAHPTSLSGRQRRVNTRHLLLCFVSTFLAVPSLFTPLPDFAVQAGGVEEPTAQDVLFRHGEEETFEEKEPVRREEEEQDLIAGVYGATRFGAAADKEHSARSRTTSRQSRGRSTYYSSLGAGPHYRQEEPRLLHHPVHHPRGPSELGHSYRLLPHPK
ncbi:hypothetical protein NCLIV_005480 [Neospora caninum Liverpool]|uniref:Uncharacterized protein n=1 Tax=Neospora caninum (strain Liverpool) TaxID=572307 RepID=F0V8N1_NEOCL|nr:hypothetical protein NCLIV_005480 [Neospora caninum Liverpool]CBZ50072.1 hypothetical protein NCLIV_005480 [Neospora caninum Liverpool]CEL64666.1 TPA: hypothetical protein BN1204_005480 [Neospora caninum Liverpool]|eukprot:XP_003880107.1 hypothetical protein NCLIV_005480 [Neospora caninum Liverpool]